VPKPARLWNLQCTLPSRALVLPTLQSLRVWNGGVCRAALQGALGAHGACAAPAGDEGARGAQGNDARYINHSCDPNAYTKIVTVDGVKHVAIVAARAIAAGAEVSYDYKVRGAGLQSATSRIRVIITRPTLPALPSLQQLSRVREQAAAQSGPGSQPVLFAHSLRAGTRLRIQRSAPAAAVGAGVARDLFGKASRVLP
jgi:hypothetical protein